MNNERNRFKSSEIALVEYCPNDIEKLFTNECLYFRDNLFSKSYDKKKVQELFEMLYNKNLIDNRCISKCRSHYSITYFFM